MVWPNRYKGTRRNLIRGEQIGLSGRVNIQQDNHRRWLRGLEGNLETNLDLHAVLSTLPVFEATTQRPFRLA
jgi:hypothetical protein